MEKGLGGLVVEEAAALLFLLSERARHCLGNLKDGDEVGGG